MGADNFLFLSAVVSYFSYFFRVIVPKIGEIGGEGGFNILHPTKKCLKNIKTNLNPKIKIYKSYLQDSCICAEKTVTSSLDKYGGLDIFSKEHFSKLDDKEQKTLIEKVSRDLPCPVDLKMVPDFWPNFLMRLGLLRFNLESFSEIS